MPELRNTLTGIIFGKYNIRDIAEDLTLKDEEYVGGMEEVFFSEAGIASGGVLAFLSLALSVLSSPFYLPLLLPAVVSIFLSIQLEVVFLTPERIFIERRGVVEKLLRVRNVTTVSLEQIAVLNYGRAPFNYPLLVLSVPLLVTEFFLLRLSPFIAVIIPSTIYLIWYALRVGKRSIELSVIGMQRPVGIGRLKGAPMEFLKLVQEQVFERIHHYEQHEREIHEFPLQYSSTFKKTMQLLTDPVEKQVLVAVGEGRLTSEEVRGKCSCTDHEFHSALARLLSKGIISYSEGKYCFRSP